MAKANCVNPGSSIVKIASGDVKNALKANNACVEVGARVRVKTEVEVFNLSIESAQEDIKPDNCLKQSTTRKRKF